MNQRLIDKMLQKISLKELYDEIKDNDVLLLNLGMAILKHQKLQFASMIRKHIEYLIDNEKSSANNADIVNIVKNLILNLDTVSDSANLIVKNKISKSSKPVNTSISDDPCGRGVGFTPTC